jgi:hypothetical protein
MFCKEERDEKRNQEGVGDEIEKNLSRMCRKNNGLSIVPANQGDPTRDGIGPKECRDSSFAF